MREQYWKMYFTLKHRFFYYKRFQTTFLFINKILSGFCMLTSLSCVAAWYIWKTHSLLWSSLICAVQIFQALCPKLPYNDLLISTKYMISSMDKLLLKVRHTWLKIECEQVQSDEEIRDLIEKYECQHTELLSQFFDGTFLPEITYLSRKAEKECGTHFQVNYFSNEEVQDTMKNQNNPKPITRPIPAPIEKRNDGGGAPGPSYSIPCPPKPKKN